MSQQDKEPTLNCTRCGRPISIMKAVTGVNGQGHEKCMTETMHSMRSVEREHIPHSLIEEVDVSVLEIEDRYFDSSIEKEYSISDVELKDETFDEFSKFVAEREGCIYLRAFRQDDRQTLVEFYNIEFNNETLLVVRGRSCIGWLSTSNKELLTKFVDDFNKRV